jgi:hypothetical protein
MDLIPENSARIENRNIAEWADYYDGLTSRRIALAAHFEEWVEL